MPRLKDRNMQVPGGYQFYLPEEFRTIRTKLAELGEPDHIAERVLGHKLQGVMAVYNRHGYDTEKKAALERWENRLKEIVGSIEEASHA